MLHTVVYDKMTSANRITNDLEANWLLGTLTLVILGSRCTRSYSVVSVNKSTIHTAD